jgi:exosome complex component RRP4
MLKNTNEFEKKILKTVVPGEEIASVKNGFMSGFGTFTEEGIIYSALSGIVETINKLITVIPKNKPYKAEVGDVIIGRVIAVDKKSWRVNINSSRDANLNLTSINLPKGEQRRRSEDDVMQMRLFFEENDILSGEVQQVHNDGGVNIQTRNLKYGKLKNGILIEVNHNLIRKMKAHFVDLIPDIKAIVGMNGLIWIYYSTVKMDSNYFTDDQNLVNTINKHETPTEWASVHIILFKNIIKLLEKHKIVVDHFTITKFHELYIQSIESLNNGISDLDYLKKNIVISSIIEIDIIAKVKQLVSGKEAKYAELNLQIKNMTKMMEEGDSGDDMMDG